MDIRKEIEKVKKLIEEEQGSEAPSQEHIKKLTRTLMLLSMELPNSQMRPQTKIMP